VNARRILGVDPGLRTTGYGVVEVRDGALQLIEGGVLQPNPKDPLAQRLVQLHDAMVEVVRATRPDCMVVEELWTAYEHPQTAVLMGHARGVIALAAGANGLTVHDLAHTSVKRAVAGSGSATKAQVKGMVVQLLGLTAPTSAMPSRSRSPSRTWKHNATASPNSAWCSPRAAPAPPGSPSVLSHLRDRARARG
jgi:crossover junction endodeoxyribonuclease RuvC